MNKMFTADDYSPPHKSRINTLVLFSEFKNVVENLLIEKADIIRTPCATQSAVGANCGRVDRSMGDDFISRTFSDNGVRNLAFS